MAKNSPTTPAETAATILAVPVEQLRESPFNPRKHYSEAALRELSLSIASQGMLQPIVARPLPGAAQDIWVRYEIVFGHRRFRAAQLAELPTVPVVLRDFTDHQAALAQVAENLQRQDVSPLEEADSFIRLHADHGMTADQIAAGVAKSRSYVYGRLKLAKVAPEVRAAISDDGLPVDIAIEVARLTEPALQKRALKDLKGTAYGEAWPSVRYAQQRVRGMFDNNVDEAAFDPADASLAKLAGPCTTCPKRAGNDPDLQGVVAAGVCTDRLCFEGKTREHNRVELVVLANQGHRVIQGPAADAMLPSRRGAPEGYSSVDAGDYVGGEFMSFANMLRAVAQRGGDAPKTTVIALDNCADVRHFITDAQAADLVRELEGKAEDDDGASTPSTAGASARQRAVDPAVDLSGWSPAELVARDIDGWLRVKSAVMSALLHVPRTTDDMRLILMREYDMADDFGLVSEAMGLKAEERAAAEAWEADTERREPFSCRAWWEARLATLTADQLAALLLGVALEDLLGYGRSSMDRETAARRVALAERYGVDVVAASRPEQMDDAGAAGGRTATAGAANSTQLDAFAEA